MSNLIRKQRDDEVAPNVQPIVPVIGNPAMAAPRQELSTAPLASPVSDLTAPELADPVLPGQQDFDLTPEKLDVQYEPQLPEQVYDPLQFPVITNPGPDVMFEGPTRTELKGARQYVVPQAQFVRNLPEQMMAPPVDSDNDPIFNSTGDAYKPWWEQMMGGLGSVFGKAWGSTDNREGGPLEIVQDRLVNGSWWQRLPFFQIPQLRDAANGAIDRLQTAAPNPDFGDGPLSALFYGLSLPQNVGMGLAADIGQAAANTFYGVTGSTDINPATWDVDLANIVPGNRRPDRVLPSPDGVPLPYVVRALLGTDMGFTNLQQSGTGSFNPFGVVAADTADLAAKSDGEIMVRAAGALALDMITGQPFDAFISGARRQAARVVDEPGGEMVHVPRVHEGELVQPGVVPPARGLPSGTRRVDVPTARVQQLELPAPRIVTHNTPDVKFQAAGVMRDPTQYRTLFSPEGFSNIQVQVPTIRGFDVSVASVPKGLARTFSTAGRTINVLPAQVFSPQAAVADLARYVAESPVARTIDPARMTAAPRAVPDRVRLLNAYTPVVPSSTITAKTVNAITESLVTSRRFVAATTGQLGVPVPRALPAASSFVPVVPKRLAQFTNRPTRSYTREIVRQLEAVMPATVVPSIPTLPPVVITLPPQAVVTARALDSVVYNTPEATVKAFVTPGVAIQREVSAARAFQDAPYVPVITRVTADTIEYAPFEGARLTPESDLEAVALIAEDVIARGYVGKGLEVDDFRVTPEGGVMLVNPGRLVRAASPEQVGTFRQEVATLVQNVVDRSELTPEQMDFVTAVQRAMKDMLEPSVAVTPAAYDEIAEMLPDELRTIDGTLTPEIAAHTDELVSALDQLEEFTDQLKSLESQVFETSRMVSKPFTSGVIADGGMSGATLFRNADGTVSKYLPSDSIGPRDASHLRAEYDTMLAMPEKPYLMRPLSWEGNGYTMPYIEGVDMIDAHHLSPEQMDDVVQQVSAAMRDLAINGWYLGDLHGGNVRVTPDNRAILIDMGESYRADSLSRDDADDMLDMLDFQFNEEAKYVLANAAPAKVPVPFGARGELLPEWVLLTDKLGLTEEARYGEVFGQLPEDVKNLLRELPGDIDVHDILDAMQVVENAAAQDLVRSFDDTITGDAVAEVRNRMGLPPIPGQTPSAFINDDDVWGAMGEDLFNRAAAFAGANDIEFEHVARALFDEPPKPAFQMLEGTPIARGRGSKAYVYANPDGTISKFIDQLTTAPDTYNELVQGLRDEFALLQQLADIEAFPRALEWEGNGFKMEQIDGVNVVDYYEVGDDLRPVANISHEQITGVVEQVRAVAAELYEKHNMLMVDLHGANVMIQPDGKVRVIDIADAYHAGSLTEDDVFDANWAATELLSDDLHMGQNAAREGMNAYDVTSPRSTDVLQESEVLTQLGLAPGATMIDVIDAMPLDAYERLMREVGGEEGATLDAVQRALVPSPEGVVPSVGANIPGDNAGVIPGKTDGVVRADPGTPSGNRVADVLAANYTKENMNDYVFYSGERVKGRISDYGIGQYDISFDVDGAVDAGGGNVPFGELKDLRAAFRALTEKLPEGTHLSAMAAGGEHATKTQLYKDLGGFVDDTRYEDVLGILQFVVGDNRMPSRVRPGPRKLETVDINGDAWPHQIRALAKVDLPLPAEVLADFRTRGLMRGPRILDPEGLITAIREYKEGDALRVVTQQYNDAPFDNHKQLLAQAQDELEYQAQQVRAAAEGALNRVEAASDKLETSVSAHNRKVQAAQDEAAQASYRRRDTNLGSGNRSSCL